MKKVMMNNGNEIVKNGKEVKKMSNKMIIGEMLMEEMKKDVRFKGMKNIDKVIGKIESLRKNGDSHLSDFAYALFIAYKNGLNVFRKYMKNFVATLEADYNAYIEERKYKVRRYTNLINTFRMVNGFVNLKKIA